MMWKRIFYVVIGWIILQVGYTEEYEYFIIKDTNTAVYEKPDVKSKKVKIEIYDYEGFYEGEIVRAYEITNIKGIEWALIFKEIPKWRGWVKMTNNVYRFKEDGENGKLFWEFVKKEIFEYRGFEKARVVDVSFTNFNNGYVMIHYADFDDAAFYPISVPYKLEN